MSLSDPSTPKLVRGLALVLVASAAYLDPFPQANLINPAVALIHVVAGVLATIAVSFTHDTELAQIESFAGHHD